MDSPKCLQCLTRGIIAQTYRVAGTQTFKCHECNFLFTKDTFEEDDFKWKTEPGKWKERHSFPADYVIADGKIKSAKGKRDKKPKKK